VENVADRKTAAVICAKSLVISMQTDDILAKDVEIANLKAQLAAKETSVKKMQSDCDKAITKTKSSCEAKVTSIKAECDAKVASIKAKCEAQVAKKDKEIKKLEENFKQGLKRVLDMNTDLQAKLKENSAATWERFKAAADAVRAAHSSRGISE
jgi:hypothetical protein